MECMLFRKNFAILGFAINMSRRQEVDRFATSPSFVLLTDPHVKQPTVNVRLSSHSGTLDFITPHL